MANVFDTPEEEEEEQQVTPLSPENIQKMMREQFNATQQARQAVPAARAIAEGQVQSANEQYSGVLVNQNRQAKEAIANFRAASDRRTELEQYPDVVTKLLSFIDQDFDPDVQVQKMQRSQFELGVVSSNLKTADAMRVQHIERAKANLKSTTDIFNFNREGFVDLANASAIGFQLRENTRQEHVQFVKDQTDKQLQEWEKHPNSMPRIIANNPQLVSAELFNRKVKSAGLNATELANTQQRNTLLDGQREDFLDEFDPDGLRIAHEEFQRNPKKFPDYMRDRDFVGEIERQTSIMLTLRNAGNALAKGDIELAEANKLIAIKKSSVRDIDKTLAQMGTASSVNLLDVPFSRTELELARASKVNASREADRANAVLATMIGNTDVNRKSTMRLAELIAKFDNPYGTNPTLSPALERELGATMNVDKILDPIVQSGNIGAAQTQAQAWEASAKTMQEEVDAIVEAQPKAVRAGTAEYFRSGGNVNDPANAAALVFANGGNPYILDGSPLLAGPQHALAAEMQDLASVSSFSIDPSTGEFSASKGDKEAAVLIQQAIDNSGFRKKLADAGYQALLQSALIDLINLSEPTKDVATTGKLGPTSIYRNLINPQTGALSRSLYKSNADDQRIFSFQFLNEAYADIQIQAQKDGVIHADEQVTDPVLSLMRERVADLNLAFRASPYSAALKTAAFPNGVDSMLHESLRATDADLPAIVAQAIKTKRSLEIVIQQQLLEETEGPGLGSLVD